jgi:hypothetical protein
MPYKPTGRPPGRPRKTLPITGRKPVLTSAQWRGVRAEFRLDRGGPLFTGRVTAVAERAGVSRIMVYKWRRDPSYEQGVYWLWGRLMARNLRERNRPPRLEPLNKRQLSALIGARICNEWRGPVESPLDGNLYTTLEDYAKHVNSMNLSDAHGLIFEEDQSGLREQQRLAASRGFDSQKSGIRLTERVLQKLFA